MDGMSLLQDFAVTLLVAAVAGWIFRKCGLSAVVGYLIAGIIIGPYTPPFTLVSDVDRIEALSDLGLAFLMFFVGLGLSLRRIRQLGFAVVGATALTALGVYQLCQIFAAGMGWPALTGLMFAGMLMTSSSAIITKMLAERGLLHERHAQTAQGVTVLEDVVAVVMLTLIGAHLGMSGGNAPSVAQVVFLLVAFAVMVVVSGLILVPRLFAFFGGSSDADLKSILVAGLVCGAGVGAMSAGFSVALGAFLIGVVVAESPFRVRIEKRLAGAQDMFSSIFFVSIGMLIDVRAFWEEGTLILAISAFALLARTLAATAGLVAVGSTISLAASSAVLLTPIGEFSYIIAKLGIEAGALPDSFYAVAVGVSLITAGVLPLLAKIALPWGALVESLLPSFLAGLVHRYQRALGSCFDVFAASRVLRLSRRRLTLAGIELLLLTGLLGFSGILKAGIGGFLLRAGYELPYWDWVFESAVMALAAVLLGGLWRSATVLSMIYAEALTKKIPRMRRAVQLTLQAAVALGLVALVLNISPVLSEFRWAGVVGILAALAVATLLWRQMTRLQSAFESSLESSTAFGGGNSRGLIREENRVRDWQTSVAELQLPEFTTCAGRSLGELAVRGKFGCTVIEVDRQGYVVANPGPDFALFPGDRVLLLGSTESIAKTRALLESERAFSERETDFDSSSLQTFLVPEGPGTNGHSLKELRIFGRTGVQIVGIRRNGQRIANPSGPELILGGDELLAVGTPNEMRRLRELLATMENPPDDSPAPTDSKSTPASA